MNKAFLMATALMLAPLPAVSQENQTSRDRNTSSITSENRGINSERRGEDRGTSGMTGESGGEEERGSRCHARCAEVSRMTGALNSRTWWRSLRRVNCATIGRAPASTRAASAR